MFGLALDLKHHLIVVLRHIAGADIDLNVDRRRLLLGGELGGGSGILEREILGILGQHIQLG
jgi:hypothetical protein